MFYVYLHKVNGKVIYVGSTENLYRAYEFNPTKRIKNHLEEFNKSVTDGTFYVEVLPPYASKVIMLLAEAELIAKYNSPLNIARPVTPAQIKWAISEMNSGRSLRNCAEEIGIAHDNLRLGIERYKSTF